MQFERDGGGGGRGVVERSPCGSGRREGEGGVGAELCGLAVGRGPACGVDGDGHGGELGRARRGRALRLPEVEVAAGGRHGGHRAARGHGGGEAGSGLAGE